MTPILAIATVNTLHGRERIIVELLGPTSTPQCFVCREPDSLKQYILHTSQLMLHWKKPSEEPSA